MLNGVHRTRGVEMLMTCSVVETLDDSCADGAQLIHEHRVPRLPDRRESGPRRSLNVSLSPALGVGFP
jgi:hypothetical protein